MNPNPVLKFCITREKFVFSSALDFQLLRRRRSGFMRGEMEVRIKCKLLMCPKRSFMKNKRNLKHLF